MSLLRERNHFPVFNSTNILLLSDQRNLILEATHFAPNRAKTKRPLFRSGLFLCPNLFQELEQEPDSKANRPGILKELR